MRTRIAVVVTPRGTKSEVVGMQESELKVRVAAPPTQGRANVELTRFLALRLCLPASHVAVICGHGSRHKIVEVVGLTRTEIMRTLCP